MVREIYKNARHIRIGCSGQVPWSERGGGNHSKTTTEAKRVVDLEQRHSNHKSEKIFDYAFAAPLDRFCAIA